MSGAEDLNKLINIHSRRLQKLKEQQAHEGHSADPKIQLEIEDIEAEIKKLQEELEPFAPSSHNPEAPSSFTKPEKPVLDASQRQFSRSARAYSTGHPPAEPNIDFVIVTALEEERDAVLHKLPGHRRLPPSDDDVRVYYSANVPVTFADGSTGTYQVIVMQLLGMGRVQATIATADAIRRWQPRYVLLVGIAGGVAVKEVRLGDILVADQVVDYELQKQTSRGVQVRWVVHPVDARLLGAARNLRIDEWQPTLAAQHPGEGMSVRHVGPVASGDKVIAFDKVLTKYRKTWPAIIGVEMEAAGAATAVFQAAKPPGFLMVRGVSDLADEDKNSAKVQNWRGYACDAAAGYAVALLKSGPVMLSPLSTEQDSPVEENKQKAPDTGVASCTPPIVKPSSEPSPLPPMYKAEPSWILGFPKPQPFLPESPISAVLKGYPLFRSQLADHELEFLFGEVSCFWSRHPTYVVISSNFYPQIIAAKTGSGKTAFAYALTQIGSADGNPLEDTLPILIANNTRTFEDVQDQFATALLKFISRNLAILNSLSSSEKKFLIHFLGKGLETDLFKVRLNKLIEADKSLAAMIEGSSPYRPDQNHCLPHARQCLELLRLKRAILAVDFNCPDATSLEFWLRDMPGWSADGLTIKLFVTENHVQKLDQVSDQVEILSLDWRDYQIADMVNWRFGSLARLTDIRTNLEALFDDGICPQFLAQAEGNPGRLARLWGYLFDDHLNHSPARSTFSAENLARAVRKLK